MDHGDAIAVELAGRQRQRQLDAADRDAAGVRRMHPRDFTDYMSWLEAHEKAQ